MTSYYTTKRQSLVEKKKQQWAKEREELDNLTTSTWGDNSSFNRYSKTRSGDFESRQSLPPIYDTPNSAGTYILRMDRDICAETSGYGSDSAIHSTPEYLSPDGGNKMRNIWENQVLEDEAKNDPPGWLKRGLQRNCEIIVAEETEGSERPTTTSSGSSQFRSHLRGQNIPLEPLELQERERKRQIALDHQNAIKAQLEEREQKRKEERKRRLREEAEEEERIRREREIEEERMEMEAQRKRDKQEAEQRRNEAMYEALEQAEKEAKKERTKHRKQETPRTEEPKKVEKVSPKVEEVVKEPVNDEVVLQIEDHIIAEPLETNPQANLPQGLESLSNLQLAIVVPPINLGANVPIAVPVILSNDRTENRILTPSIYRNKCHYCDSSTQTDFPVSATAFVESSTLTEKLEKLEVSEMSKLTKSNKDSIASIEDRPKWGVNRPPTRYMKQSEKDPLYQRRKLRQSRSRQPKIKRYSPHSSDESAVSPRPIQNRRTRSLWIKQDMLPSKMGMFQTEIVQLETDKDQIYYKTNSAGYKSYYELDNETNVLTLKHPASSRAYKDDRRVLEDLQRLKNGLSQKQEQFDDK